MNLAGKVSQEDRERVRDIRNHPQYQSGFGDDDGLGGDDDMGDFSFDDLFGDDDGGSFGSDNSSSGFGGGSSGGFGGDSGFGGGSSGGFGGGSSSGFGGGSSNGFGNSGFGGGASSGFGNNSGFGGGASNGFGNSGFGNSGFGNNGFGNNGFGNSGFGGGGFNNIQNSFGENPFNQNNQQQQQVQQKDSMDMLMDASVETAKSLGIVMKELFVSLKDRNADDFGYLSRNMIITGGIIVPISIILGIIGTAADIKMLSFAGLGLQMALAGGITLTSGITGIGVSAFVLSKQGDQIPMSVDNIPDEPPSIDNAVNEYEDSIGDELDDLFGDDFDSLFDDIDDTPAEPAEPEEPFELEVDITPEPIDYNLKLDNIEANRVISRASLFNTFIEMFTPNTPKFASVKVLDTDSADFTTLETICMKALSNLANCEVEEVNSSLEEAKETLFSYELKIKRINKVKRAEGLAKEIEVYMKSSEDPNVCATAILEGDYYKVTVTKGETAVVTFGDVFKLDYCREFFLDTKKKLPVVTGIDELGNVILEDAKVFDTMLIAGKPRSGKSWYVLSILMCLMLFNSPEDVQFIIVDPKESNLFKQISLLPHVCGLHNDEHIIDIFDEIIEIEAPRRKKMVDDHKCDDIWALRNKGVSLPVLYIVIDEYITVKNNMDKDQQKEFNSKFQTIMSQFPSLGIRLLFVPHRATGIVDKTNRTMLQFTAAVRADSDDVIDTLGIKKWDRALTQPGDIAIKSSSMTDAKYVRGAALTTSDEENSKFIEAAAKVFYKLGVDIPDMSRLKVSRNRDEDYIREILSGEGTRIQYNANTIFNDIENMDFKDI